MILWAQSPSPSWIWAKRMYGPYFEYTTKMETDKADNHYIGGYFDSWICYNTTTVNTNGGKDCFLAKFDSNGNIIKFLNFGSSQNFSGADERITAMTIDNNNNLYISGYYNTNNFVLGNYTLSSSSGPIFYAKLDSALNVQWIKTIKCTPISKSNYLKADTSNGFLYMCGKYINGTVIDTYTLPTGQYFNALTLIKLDYNGNMQWWKAYNTLSSSNTDLSCLELDKSGDVYVGGFCIGTATLGTTTISAGNTNEDAFLFRASKNNGDVKWVLPITSHSRDYLNSISTDLNYNLYIGGSFNDNSNYVTSTLTIGNSTLLASNYSMGNSFIARVDSTGNVIWLNKFISSNGDWLYNLKVDKNQDIVCIGKFSNGITLGSNYFSGTNASYFTKMNPNGNFIWAMKTDNNVYVKDFSFNSLNEIYSCGEFVGNRFFGTTLLMTYTVYSSTNPDIYYGKLNNPSISTKIENISNVNQFNLYPNPASGTLRLSDTENIQKICLFTFDGKFIKEFTGEYLNESLDISDVAKGIYILKVINSDSKIYPYKLIVE